MTLAEQRQVIEVLLCAAQGVDDLIGYGAMTTHQAAADLGLQAGRCRYYSDREWKRSDRDYIIYGPVGVDVDHGTKCLEAAYRLIESSTTLRREWFGR